MNFEALQGEIAKDLAEAKVLRPLNALAVARRLLASKDRFLGLEKLCGVPALWTMPVFEREGGGFSAYLGNGDPLTRATTDIPRRRGPFASWEEGAQDALRLDHIAEADEEWSWALACYKWELWNGFGPRLHGRPTGYVWSWTSVYAGGKYVADGVWSRGTWDQQAGCVAIARAIVSLAPELNFKPAQPAVPSAGQAVAQTPGSGTASP